MVKMNSVISDLLYRLHTYKKEGKEDSVKSFVLKIRGYVHRVMSYVPKHPEDGRCYRTTLFLHTPFYSERIFYADLSGSPLGLPV